MQCEICGKNTPETVYISLDGAILSVCDECSKYGSIVEEPVVRDYKPPKKIEYKKPAIKDKTPVNSENILQVKPDYFKIIKTEREKRKLTQEELARLLKEKPSIISKIETGKFEPDESLVKKIEKLFNIKLMEPTEIPASNTISKSSELTLGDVINLKKRSSDLKNT
ncbi:MAG: multiprotein bridging factor aMBF1 [Candidatus Odinarchaeota archaeon]